MRSGRVLGMEVTIAVSTSAGAMALTVMPFAANRCVLEVGQADDAGLCLLLALASQSWAVDKRGLAEMYKHKYLVVLRDGLAVGICGEYAASSTANGIDLLPGSWEPYLTVKISGDTASYKPEETGAQATLVTGCGTITAEPIRKGDILAVERVYFQGDERFDFYGCRAPG